MIGIALLAWFAFGWLLITEFSYLPGNGLTIWLYDRLASLYPRKTGSRAYVDVATQERILLAPFRRLCETREQPRILDIGCGSGRASLLLIRQPWFTGRIVAVDLSEAMLAQFREAREALAEPLRERIEIRRAGATEHLEQTPPVDACLLLEVGEFIAGFPRLIEGIASRVKPGGLLVLTRPPFPYSLLFPFRAQTWTAMKRLLVNCGFSRVESRDWRRRYSVVHAWRADTQPPRPS